MRDEMRARLEELRKEFETGQGKLQDLERQQSLLRETVLRISGAIQILEELLNRDGPAGEREPVPFKKAN